MRLMFVYYLFDDAGSVQDMHHYVRAARRLGHEVVIYAPPGTHPVFECSLDVESADALVFVFEWTTQLRHGDRLDLARLVGKMPRRRRVVIDCDGAYNPAICVDGDYNHREPCSSQTWMDVCDSLSDKVCQPTLHPLRPNVRTFFFHGYDPGWEKPLEFDNKDFGMLYIGHSKFRWNPMYRVLRALEPIRERVGRIGLVGHGWDSMPVWAAPMNIEDIYYSDPKYLAKLRVEFIQPIPVAEVIPWMSQAVFNPVIYRPLFSHLKFVTCRTFETAAAATIPLFGLDSDYVAELYGNAAIELVLPQHDAEEKIARIVSRPGDYADVVRGVRRHLADKHSYQIRLQQLIEIVHS
jgi:hypothetical protein